MKDFDRTAEEVRGVGGTILGEGQCRVASCIYNFLKYLKFLREGSSRSFDSNIVCYT